MFQKPARFVARKLLRKEGRRRAKASFEKHLFLEQRREEISSERSHITIRARLYEPRGALCLPKTPSAPARVPPGPCNNVTWLSS
jgi:hypothetical protein